MNKTLLPFTFALSQVMDVLSTHVAINGFSLEESNPMANAYFATFGMAGSMLVKMTVALVIVGIYTLSLKRLRRLRKAINISLHIGNIITWTAVFINLIGIGIAISTS